MAQEYRVAYIAWWIRFCYLFFSHILTLRRSTLNRSAKVLYIMTWTYFKRSNKRQMVNTKSAKEMKDGRMKRKQTNVNTLVMWMCVIIYCMSEQQRDRYSDMVAWRAFAIQTYIPLLFFWFLVDSSGFGPVVFLSRSLKIWWIIARIMYIIPAE